MFAGDPRQAADIRPTVTLDRRPRNWLLFGNIVAWVIIIAILRWLFA